MAKHHPSVRTDRYDEGYIDSDGIVRITRRDIRVKAAARRVPKRITARERQLMEPKPVPPIDKEEVRSLVMTASRVRTSTTCGKAEPC